MAQILGGILAVYLLTLLFNFIFKKIRKTDTKLQRIISICIAIILASTIYTYNGLSMQQASEEIFYGIVAYIIGGIVVAITMLRKKKSNKDIKPDEKKSL